MGKRLNKGLQEKIFLSIMNQFHTSIIEVDRPTSNIAFGGKIKIVNFFNNLIFRWYLIEVDVKYTVITTLEFKVLSS